MLYIPSSEFEYRSWSVVNEDYEMRKLAIIFRHCIHLLVSAERHGLSDKRIERSFAHLFKQQGWGEN